MTQEEKQPLLKDLCARLPYGVMCRLSVKGENVSITEKLKIGGLEHFMFGTMDVKPYLRPMSSMTDEEYNEYDKATDLDTADSAETLRENLKAKARIRISKWYHGTDWLNEHHFDYRGLIPMGLALEATEGMYKND